MEIISACIEGGCYSAVFAVLLVYALRNGAKRENYYRAVINELVAGLSDLETVNIRLEEIKKMCVTRDKARGRSKCACSEQQISVTEPC